VSLLVGSDFLEVVIEAGVKSGLLEVVLSEFLKTFVVKVLLKMLKGKSIVEDHTVINTGGCSLAPLESWRGHGQAGQRSEDCSVHLEE
jgi:hypothetical protein